MSATALWAMAMLASARPARKQATISRPSIRACTAAAISAYAPALAHSEMSRIGLRPEAIGQRADDRRGDELGQRIHAPATTPRTIVRVASPALAGQHPAVGAKEQRREHGDHQAVADEPDEHDQVQRQYPPNVNRLATRGLPHYMRA